MAIIREGIWGQGRTYRLGAGYHYNKKIGFMVVPEGQIVTFYEKRDRTGKKSTPFYEGTYQHLAFYGISRNPGVIHIEKTPLTNKDMVEAYRRQEYGSGNNKGHYRMTWMLPIGDLIEGQHFPNNRIQGLFIPFGITIECFDRNNFTGGSLVFSGSDQNRRTEINLKNYSYSGKISSVKVKADNWERIGIELKNVQVDTDDDKKIAAVTELYNNSPYTATVGKEISWTKEMSTEENWNIGSRVCTRAGFETETKIGPVKGTVTAEVEVEVSGGYGEVKGTSDSKEITDTVSAEIESFGKVKISTIVEYGKMTADAICKWKNTRTGDILEIPGKIKASWSSDATHEVNGKKVTPEERSEE